jgi:hypothetical protein
MVQTIVAQELFLSLSAEPGGLVSAPDTSVKGADLAAYLLTCTTLVALLPAASRATTWIV